MHKVQPSEPSWFPLIAHKVRSRIFNLSAGLNYVSIKDQVVRACALIESLKAATMLESHGNPAIYDVVVVGAGAAGVTAAWEAASSGARVRVIEKEAFPFPAQLKCSQRDVSFSMYDWPETFANAGEFPSLSHQPIKGTNPNGGLFPCFADADDPLPANVRAQQWTKRLDLSGLTKCSPTAAYPIEWTFSATASPPIVEPNPILDGVGFRTVEIVETGKVSTIKANIIILATGIGVEKSVDSYTPPAFWIDNDDAPWSKNHASKTTVVISGAGDGAIQDTIKSLAKGTLRNLIPHADRLLKKGTVRNKKALILAAERHAERQLLWGVNADSVYGSLQEIYDEIVKSIPSVHIAAWRDEHLRTDIAVEWFLDGLSFKKSYPLNRFFGSILRRSELSSLVSFKNSKLRSVASHGAQWYCEAEDGTMVSSVTLPLFDVSLNRNR